jgi:sulfur carrier protein
MKIILPDKTVLERTGASLSVDTLLGELGLNPVEVMVARNGTLVPGDALLHNDDDIRIYRITHGG